MPFEPETQPIVKKSKQLALLSKYEMYQTIPKPELTTWETGIFAIRNAIKKHMDTFKIEKIYINEKSFISIDKLNELLDLTYSSTTQLIGSYSFETDPIHDYDLSLIHI